MTAPDLALRTLATRRPSRDFWPTKCLWPSRSDTLGVPDGHWRCSHDTGHDGEHLGRYCHTDQAYVAWEGPWVSENELADTPTETFPLDSHPSEDPEMTGNETVTGQWVRLGGACAEGLPGPDGRPCEVAVWGWLTDRADGIGPRLAHAHATVQSVREPINDSR